MIHVYCFYSTKQIVLSDRPSAAIIDRYSRQYEILNSFREKDSARVIINRLSRNYHGFEIVEWYIPEKRQLPPWTDERRAHHSKMMKGKVKSEEAKAKTSAKMKGRSNFAGKKHREESKQKTSVAMEGNDNAAGLIWCHHPVTGEEKRVASELDIPPGWRAGREYYSIEALVLNQK